MQTHDEEEQNAIDFVQSKNKCKLYQATLKEVENNKSIKAKEHMELEAIAQSARDNTLELSKETQDKMVEFVNNNSKATLQDVIKEFFNK